MQKVKWGIIGTANINYKIAPWFTKTENAELVGIASRSIHKAKNAVKEFRAKKAFENYTKLIDYNNIDAVYIPLPNSMHLEWIVKAAESGKHVLSEKPLAVNVNEAKHAVEVCKDNNVLLMEGFMYRHHPQHEKVREIISSGRIGKILGFHSALCYNVYPTPENIRWRPELGGGALMDLGGYCIDSSRLILNSEPIGAKAHCIMHPDRKVDSTTIAILQFQGDRYASFTCSFCMGFIDFYEVLGTQGKIRVEPSFISYGDSVVKVKDVFGIENVLVEGLNPYFSEIRHFSNCIQEGKLLPPAENGLNNMRSIDLIREDIKKDLK